MHIYMTHMRSLALTIQQGGLYMYLTNIIQEIWLTHSKYISHGQHAVWVYRPNIFAHMCQKHSQLHLLLHMVLPNMCKIQICQPNWAYKSYIPNILCAYLEDECEYMCHI